MDTGPVHSHDVTVYVPSFTVLSIQARMARLRWSRWLVTYRGGLPAHKRLPIPVLTRSNVKQLHWSKLCSTIKPNCKIPQSMERSNNSSGIFWKRGDFKSIGNRKRLLPRWITAILLSNSVCNPQNIAGKLNLLHLAVPTEMSMTTRMKWNLITRQGHVKVTSADHFAPAELLRFRQLGFLAPRYYSISSLLVSRNSL